MRGDPLPFADRSSAGRALGQELRQQLASPVDAAASQHAMPPQVAPLLILGLPRGGVPVAAEVARALDAPLDVLTARKVGLPQQPELAIGAVAGDDVVVRDPLAMLPGIVDEATFSLLAHAARAELRRREQAYRAGRGPLTLAGRTVVLVDDGLATGATMLAAVRAARRGGATRIIVAVPVASPQAVSLLAREADQVIALRAPVQLASIGQWYDDFSQLDDPSVCALLAGPPPMRRNDRDEASHR
jgi:predicted phosphoribosyltransferase